MLRIHVALGGLLLAAALPASAQAATNSCRSASTAPGNRIVAASSKAVVFTSRKFKQDVACTYKDKRQVKLENIACCSVLRYRLGGRYLAYAYRLDEADNEVDELGVVDLRTGRRLKYGKVRRVSTYGYVGAFYVTATGTLAWSQTELDFGGDVTKRSVRAAAAGGPNDELDAGKGIATRSLGLSSDGKTLYWTRDGAVQTHALR